MQYFSFNERQAAYDKIRLNDHQKKNKEEVKQCQMSDEVSWSVPVGFLANKKKL